jgi:glycosyl transferase, family 25
MRAARAGSRAKPSIQPADALAAIMRAGDERQRVGSSPDKEGATPPACGGFGVYLINLDQSVDRLVHMRDEFARAGLSFERVPGVIGGNLPPDLSPWFCDGQGRIASPLKPGEIGCEAAHLLVHRKIASGEFASVALVMEDDVQIDGRLAAVLTAALDRLPANWDILRLSNAPKRAYAPLVDLGDGFRIVRYSKVPNGAAAYLLNLSGARKLSRPGLRVRVIDEYLRRPWLAGLETYGIAPPPVLVGDRFASIIDSHSPRYCRPRRLDFPRLLARCDLSRLPAKLVWNIRALGAKRWFECALINGADKVARCLFRRTIIHDCADFFRD